MAPAASISTSTGTIRASHLFLCYGLLHFLEQQAYIFHGGLAGLRELGTAELHPLCLRARQRRPASAWKSSPDPRRAQRTGRRAVILTTIWPRAGGVPPPTLVRVARGRRRLRVRDLHRCSCPLAGILNLSRELPPFPPRGERSSRVSASQRGPGRVYWRLLRCRGGNYLPCASSTRAESPRERRRTRGQLAAEILRPRRSRWHSGTW